jgi:hypothetical protein
LWLFIFLYWKHWLKGATGSPCQSYYINAHLRVMIAPFYSRGRRRMSRGCRRCERQVTNI